MNFSLCRRPWLRAAKYLEQQYQRMQSRPPDQTCVSDESWYRVQKLQHRLQLANRSRFAAAQTHFRRQLAQSLRRLAKDCLHQAEDLERRELPPELPTLRLLFEELQSVQDEFDQVDIDWLTKILRVRTERIILEGIDLGPFEIRLSLDQLGCHQPYQVTALDPCRPGCCDDVTHPHVQSETLCEGEGRHPIARALEQGRLGEFFLLVAQILRTYNSGSAYCRLSDWHGSPCSDCSDTVNEDDQYTCDRCSSRLCDRCTNCCTCCDETLCNECSSTCESCQCTSCDHCLSHCDSCNDSICSGCLNDDLCPTCFEDSQENDDEETDHEEAALEPASAATTSPEATTTTAHPAVQPDCLGETLVSCVTWGRRKSAGSESPHRTICCSSRTFNSSSNTVPRSLWRSMTSLSPIFSKTRSTSAASPKRSAGFGFIHIPGVVHTRAQQITRHSSGSSAVAAGP